MALPRLKTGEIQEKLPASMMVEGEHLWFEWESVSGDVLPCCRWCMVVMPNDLDLRQKRCRGPARLDLRG